MIITLCGAVVQCVPERTGVAGNMFTKQLLNENSLKAPGSPEKDVHFTSPGSPKSSENLSLMGTRRLAGSDVLFLLASLGSE